MTNYLSWNENYLENLINNGVVSSKEEALVFLHKHDKEIRNGVETAIKLLERE